MSLVEQWRRTPRVVKWAVYAGLVLVGFFALTPVWNLWKRTEARASTLESALKQRAGFATDQSRDDSVITSVREKLGSPNMPSKLKAEAFAKVVDDILDRNNVTQRNVPERRTPLGPETTQTLGMGHIDRLILEVTFEADPSTVISVLADLEKAPEVTTVSRVRIDKTNNRDDTVRTVRATITPEAW
ncbi:MAG TPA: hypothetical protein VHC70_08585, partial [Phycisphaerales bacterium]|nr:hypothetical protein [Phycisphaerales bacterium]